MILKINQVAFHPPRLNAISSNPHPDPTASLPFPRNTITIPSLPLTNSSTSRPIGFTPFPVLIEHQYPDLASDPRTLGDPSERFISTPTVESQARQPY